MSLEDFPLISLHVVFRREKNEKNCQSTKKNVSSEKELKMCLMATRQNLRAQFKIMKK
jgi:hypothetical protein